MPATLTKRFAFATGEFVSTERLLANAQAVSRAARSVEARRWTRHSVLVQIPALTSSSPAADLTATLVIPAAPVGFGNHHVRVSRVEVTLNANDTETYTVTVAGELSKTLELVGDAAESVTASADYGDLSEPATGDITVSIAGTNSWDLAGALVLLHLDSTPASNAPAMPALELRDEMTFAAVASALNSYFSAAQGAIATLKALPQYWFDVVLLPYPSGATAGSGSSISAGALLPAQCSAGEESTFNMRVQNMAPASASAARYVAHVREGIAANATGTSANATRTGLPPTTSAITAAVTDRPRDVGGRLGVFLGRSTDSSSVDQFAFLRIVRSCYLNY
jgi:hypothetical protein